MSERIHIAYDELNPSTAVASQLVRDGQVKRAIEIARQTESEETRANLLSTVVVEIRRSPAPLGISATEIVLPADVSVGEDPADYSPSVPKAGYTEERIRPYLSARRGEFSRIRAEASKLTDSEKKAAVLLLLSHSFQAILDKELHQECLEEAASTIENINTPQNVGLQGLSMSWVRSWWVFGIVPIMAAAGVAVLGVWREIVTHYSKKAIVSLVADPELVKKLGETVRESRLIVPSDFWEEDEKTGDNIPKRRKVPH